MLPDIMSKKESERSERERRLFSVASPPPFTRPVTVAVIQTLAHKCASLSLSHHMMDYSSIFLVLLIESCTVSTGDSLFYSSLNLIDPCYSYCYSYYSCWRSCEKWTNYRNLRGTLPLLLSEFNMFGWIRCTDILKLFVVFSVCTCRLKLTCRSSAHRWPAYPHHRQVKPSFIPHHLGRNDWCRHS